MPYPPQRLGDRGQRRKQKPGERDDEAARISLALIPTLFACLLLRWLNRSGR